MPVDLGLCVCGHHHAEHDTLGCVHRIGEGLCDCKEFRNRLPYERPTFTPLGNLNDLLAGGGSQCDADGETGQSDPPGSC